MGTYILVSAIITIFALLLYFTWNLREFLSLRKDFSDARKSDPERVAQVFSDFRFWAIAGACIRMILIFGLLMLINWISTPAIAWDRSAIYWELFLALVLSWTYYNSDEELEVNMHVLGALVLLVIGALVAEISFGSWVNRDKHKNLIEMSNNDYALIMQDSTAVVDNQDSLFNHAISPISLEKMRVVSPSVAKVLAETLMGQKAAFGSQYEIGDMSLQSITGEFDITDGQGKNYHLSFEDDFIYVAPLEFRSYWKWKETDGVSQAYIIVSATNENICHMVTAVNGVPLSMKYLSSSCFSHELRRHLRYSGYMGKLADNGIQIDENGRPYNIFAQIKNQIGWSGDKVVGSIVVDMQTGEIKEYSLDDIPDFIDVVQPENLIHSLVYKHYDLIHAYIDLSDKDRLRPSENMQVVYGEKECCYYSGLTSVGRDASTSGFILVNAKTGIGTFYKMSGIDETSAESAILAHEWTAKYPSYEVGDAVMYNVGGLQTYYAPITSGRKIVGHGFCSVKNVNVVGAGKSKEEAYAAYMRAYHMSMQQVSLPSDGKDMAGKILTIKKIRQEGSRYNFLFEEYEDKTFYAFSEILPNVRWIEGIGSKVRVDFRLSDEANQVPIKEIEMVK